MLCFLLLSILFVKFYQECVKYLHPTDTNRFKGENHKKKNEDTKK